MAQNKPMQLVRFPAPPWVSDGHMSVRLTVRLVAAKLIFLLYRRFVIRHCYIVALQTVRALESLSNRYQTMSSVKGLNA
jgi:hypothetical protein